MNHTTRHTLRWSSLLLVGSALYLNGCGPDDLDDPAYLAQISDSGMINSKIEDAKTKASNRMMKPRNDKQDENMMRGPGAPPETAGPNAGMPAIPAIPVEVVQLPDAYVEFPPQVAPQPPIITQSAEAVQIQQNIYHEQPVLRPRLNQHDHYIDTNRHQTDIYHTTYIEQESFTNRVIPNPPTFTASVAVLPDTVVVAAPLVAPVVPVPVVGPIGGTFGGFFDGAWGCAPWLSGGFMRFCRPWVGPYLR